MGESACWVDQVCPQCGQVAPPVDADGNCAACAKPPDEARAGADD